MTLLKPLGLLGLIGVAILIIIYIIRPNYQQKFLSSTFVWKLSLKYRKKKIPTSKLRNLLLILCQVLILTASAFILANPAQVTQVAIDENEVVAILDASASMRTELNKVSRFERAVEMVKQSTDEVLDDGGKVSIILAKESAEFLSLRATQADRSGIENTLDDLIDNNACSYGEADIDDAIACCEEVLAENPAAKIFLYTDKKYLYVPDGISVVPVKADEEWNAGILDASTKFDNNYYTFSVDVGYYATEKYDSTSQSLVTLTLLVTNTNPSIDGFGADVTLSTQIYCERDQVKTIVFITEDNYAEIKETVEENADESVEYILLDLSQQIYSYDAVYISLDTQDDSYSNDNYFSIYNGQKPVLKVQYYSSEPNPFFSGILLTVQSAFSSRWDIRITQVKKGGTPSLSGFDLYLFEHAMPAEMPTDGVVILADPDKVPNGADFKIEEKKRYEKDLAANADSEHELLKYLNVEDITLQRYTAVTASGAYESLISCESNPLLMVKNELNSKVVLMTFSLHYSNLAILPSFPLMMCNIFDYFFPNMLSDYDFEVDETVEVKARGQHVTVYDGDKMLYQFSEFPSQFTVQAPGTYTISQTLPFSGNTLTQYIFVKASATESNIWATQDTLNDPYREAMEVEHTDDWLIYFAAALVALLFVEWWLQSREAM